jgi:hypothetical protein
MALKRSFALLAVLVLSIFVLACGDDDSSSSSDGSSDSAETQKVSFKTTETSNGKVKVTGPKTIQAGVVELTFENAGKKPHDAQLLRVEGNHSAKETIENTIASGEGKPIPEWITDGGGVGTTAPGKTVTVTQVLEPGTYYLFDTESSEGEGDGKPNALNGGQAKIEVTGEAGDGDLPETDATITAKDYSFEGEGIKPGANQLTFANEGEELHHLIAFPIKPGVKFAEVEKLFKSNEEPKGPPPVDFEKGVNTAVIDGGQSQVVDLEFQKGKYALVCFISDRKGGPPHVAMGMISELEVK